MITIDKPIPKSNNNNPFEEELRTKIRKYIETQAKARILRQRFPIRETMRSVEQAQFIHDKETGMYLGYRQLLCHTKYEETWAKSSANKFGCLAQGLKDGRVKGTDTIR